MKTCYIHLGSNVGQRSKHIHKAIGMISNRIEKVIKRSFIYETAPWGNLNQAHFLNVAIKIKTNRSPHEILVLTQQIELELGRIKTIYWGPRIIDIDILFVGKVHIEEEKLTIPHPLIQERMFVLRPLNDIASHFIHPILNKQIRTLIKYCNDKSEVIRIDE